jgi:8-oxo-dGTP pyrophosphatase MutT (NUDIX family)
MIMQFSEAELNNLTIQPVDRWKRSAAYLEEREQVWVDQMEKVVARNGHMWNGEIYSLEDILYPGEDRMTLQMSTCEYKDLVFRMLKGQEHVANHYGEVYLFRFSGVSVVPVTRDGKFVFGIRADRPEQGTPPIGGIGGTLNKDEMEIHSFADIRQCMLREIQEETALECTAETLRFFGLYAVLFSYHFWFTIRLPIHSEEINQYHRPGEFSSLVAINQQEAFDTPMPMSVGFRRWRSYLHLLPFVLDGVNPAALLGTTHSGC